MKRAVRLTLFCAAAVLAATAAALVLACVKLLPSDAELTERIRAQAEARLGVEVKVGSASLRLWPRPELVVQDAATVQPQPIRIRRLVAEPGLLALFKHRIELGEILLDGGVLPQVSLGALRLRPAPHGSEANGLQLAQLHFRDVVWITRFGLPLEFEGSALFGPGWSLRRAEMMRPGVRPLARLALDPDGDQRWRVALQLGGGSAVGHVMLRAGEDGAMVLRGELEARDVEVASALAAFKRHSALRGRSSGRTTLSAGGNNVGDLARSLHTRTTFSMASPVLLHIDLDKAIRSLGKERAGETALHSLVGQMDTQNTAQGMVIDYSGLQARGRSFTARGGGRIAKREVDAELTVDLADGRAGVPLKVAGPLSDPRVTVNAGRPAGAAVALLAEEK